MVQPAAARPTRRRSRAVLVVTVVLMMGLLRRGFKCEQRLVGVLTSPYKDGGEARFFISAPFVRDSNDKKAGC